MSRNNTKPVSWRSILFSIMMNLNPLSSTGRHWLWHSSAYWATPTTYSTTLSTGNWQTDIFLFFFFLACQKAVSSLFFFYHNGSCSLQLDSECLTALSSCHSSLSLCRRDFGVHFERQRDFVPHSGFFVEMGWNCSETVDYSVQYSIQLVWRGSVFPECASPFQTDCNNVAENQNWNLSFLH